MFDLVSGTGLSVPSLVHWQRTATDSKPQVPRGMICASKRPVAVGPADATADGIVTINAVATAAESAIGAAVGTAVGAAVGAATNMLSDVAGAVAAFVGAGTDDRSTAGSSNNADGVVGGEGRAPGSKRSSNAPPPPAHASRRARRPHSSMRDADWVLQRVRDGALPVDLTRRETLMSAMSALAEMCGACLALHTVCSRHVWSLILRTLA
jgi:hypothetical protein